MAVWQQLLPIFVGTVLPVFLVAGAGFTLARFVAIEPRSIGRLLFYLATPSLVFRSLYQTEVDALALQQLATVAITAAVLAGGLGWLISLGQERQTRAAVVLTSAVSNNGNMGIPMSYFAFGDVGMALGTIYYVLTSFLSNTFGSVIASAGQASLGAALRQSLKVPVLYAATAGLILNLTGGQIPETLLRSVDLLANAAIPGMLVLLGVQLQSTSLWQGQGVVWRSVAVRLVAGPLIAWLLCGLLGVGGVERDVLVLQAAMPTAVMTSVLATEFDTAPRLVATIIFFSTVVSMVTLSLVLWLLL
jgi:hypothetical protein